MFRSIVEISCGCGEDITHIPTSADDEKIVCPRCGKEYDFNSDDDDDFDGSGEPPQDEEFSERMKKVWERILDSLKPKEVLVPA